MSRALLRPTMALIFAALAGTSCAGVRPWEREILAHGSMDPRSADRIIAEDFVAHTFDVREGASGGAGRAGGGCGCN